MPTDPIESAGHSAPVGLPSAYGSSQAVSSAAHQVTHGHPLGLRYRTSQRHNKLHSRQLTLPQTVARSVGGARGWIIGRLNHAESVTSRSACVEGRTGYCGCVLRRGWDDRTVQVANSKDDSCWAAARQGMRLRGQIYVLLDSHRV